MQKFSIPQSYHFFINLPKNPQKSTHHKPKGRFFRSLCFSHEIICEFANQRDGSFGLFWSVLTELLFTTTNCHHTNSQIIAREKAQRPKEPSLWLPLVCGGWIFGDFLGD